MPRPRQKSHGPRPRPLLVQQQYQAAFLLCLANAFTCEDRWKNSQDRSMAMVQLAYGIYLLDGVLALCPILFDILIGSTPESRLIYKNPAQHLVFPVPRFLHPRFSSSHQSLSDFDVHLLGRTAQPGSPTAQVIAATAQVQRWKWKLLTSRFRYQISCDVM